MQTSHSSLIRYSLHYVKSDIRVLYVTYNSLPHYLPLFMRPMTLFKLLDNQFREPALYAFAVLGGSYFQSFVNSQVDSHHSTISHSVYKIAYK